MNILLIIYIYDRSNGEDVMKDIKDKDYINAPVSTDKTKVVINSKTTRKKEPEIKKNSNERLLPNEKKDGQELDKKKCNDQDVRDQSMCLENNKISPENRSPTLVGTVIKNRYIVESMLGHGGLCDVYLAKDQLLESSGSDTPYVALKVLQKEFATQPETVRMLIREAQQTQRLSHPNIVRVFDFGVEKEIYYLVMEYIDGETLEDLIQRSRPRGLNYKAAMTILNQVFDAISYSHSLGIVHADLKPANIILKSDGTVKLLDFGVSKTNQLKNDQYAAKLNYQNKETLGYTPNYASLSLLSGKEPALSDDIFALLCIAYELLSCKHPYSKKPADQALRKKIRVTKPANLPITKWATFEGAFTAGLASSDLTVDKLKRKLNQRIWPAIFGIAASILMTTGIGFTYYQQYVQTLYLEEKLSTKNSHIKASKLLLDTPAEESRELVDNDNDLHPVVRTGLLHLHKSQILNEFESRIDDVLNSHATSYPSYNEIETILEKAKSYYPDSHKLEVLALDIQSSKHSTLLSISKRINSLLEKSYYVKEGDESSIYELKDELNQIHQGYPFAPSSLSSEVFGNHLSDALKNRDAGALVTLIKVGNTFFSNVEDHKENLASSNAMKDAILEMKLYDNALDSSNPLPFPEHAARTLFREEFEGLLYRLDQANTTSQLDKLVSDLNTFSENFPQGFQDINELRFQTADKYLQFSDILINKRKTTSARKAMQKANELMKQIEQGS